MNNNRKQREKEQAKFIERVEKDEVGRVFLQLIRKQLRESAMVMMKEEVYKLCGKAYERGAKKACRRAGSEQGVLYSQEGKETIRRPRVRRSVNGDIEEEVVLESYEQISNMGNAAGLIMQCLDAGASQRALSQVMKGLPSQSEISRQWINRSAQRVRELGERDLSGYDCFAIMLDGVHVSKEVAVVVALGITCSGEKVILGFRVGASENKEVCLDLLRDISRRGFACKGKLLAIVDGSPALDEALRSMWQGVLIQRCLVHKERNVRGYLSKKHWKRLAEYFRELREAGSSERAASVSAQIAAWLGSISATALASWEEGGKRLLTVFEFDCSRELRKSLSNTNCIENIMRNYRGKTRHVCHWRKQSDHVARYSASALLAAEEGFKRIRGYQDLLSMLRALGHSASAAQAAPLRPEANASELRSAACAAEISPIQKILLAI